MGEIVYLPTVEEIAPEFVSEVEAVGGTVMECIPDDDRLYARATFQSAGAVRIGDEVRSGVALRVSGPDVSVHPYLFRQICANGAIRVDRVASRSVSRAVTERVVSAAATGAAALGEIRAAIRACAHPDVLAPTLETMRDATEHRVSVMVHLLPLMVQLPAAQRSAIAEHVRLAVLHFNAGDDESLYGLMNAVTAVARGASDPEVRWQLEVLGAGLMVHRSERDLERAMHTSLVEGGLG
jgi:hypothetical protein